MDMGAAGQGITVGTAASMCVTLGSSSLGMHPSLFPSTLRQPAPQTSQQIAWVLRASPLIPTPELELPRSLGLECEK